MYIYVRNYMFHDNRTVRLEVEPTDTIVSVMEQLEAMCGVPPILQRLAVNKGCPSYVHHDAVGTLADYEIHESSYRLAMVRHSGWYELKRKTLLARGVDIDAAPPADDNDDTVVQGLQVEGEGKKMRIVVEDNISRCRWGQKIALEVEASDTVASFMARLQRRLGYPADLLELVEERERKKMYHDSGGTLADYNVKDGSKLVLDVSRRAAVAADVEERRLKKAREIAAATEDQKLKKAKEVAASIEDPNLIPNAKETVSDVDDRKLKKAKVDRVEKTAEVPPVQQPAAAGPPQKKLSDDKSPTRP